MAAPKKPDRAAAWLTIQELSNALDITYAFCQREVLRCAAKEHIRMVGRRKYIKARPVIEAYLASKLTPIAEPDLDSLQYLAPDAETAIR